MLHCKSIRWSRARIMYTVVFAFILAHEQWIQRLIFTFGASCVLYYMLICLNRMREIVEMGMRMEIWTFQAGRGGGRRTKQKKTCSNQKPYSLRCQRAPMRKLYTHSHFPMESFCISFWFKEFIEVESKLNYVHKWNDNILSAAFYVAERAFTIANTFYIFNSIPPVSGIVSLHYLSIYIIFK